MKKINGSTWNRNKGSFGGSMPGKKKYINSYITNKTFIASVLHRGTVGTKLFKKLSK